MNTEIENLTFEEVLENYYDSILKFVVKQVSNIEDAKDLTQEIFMKTYNNFNNYNPEKAQVKTWLYKIANNHVINYWRSAYFRNKASVELNLDLLNASTDILETLIQDEDVKQILALMNKVLSKKHLKICNLHFFSDLDTQEIADTLGISKKTVYNVISLSIKKVQSKLEGYHNE